MSGTAVPPGNCVTHGYHGRTYCPRCSTSAIPPPPLGQAPTAASVRDVALDRVADMQADWFVREVKRCREIGMPLGCCDDWPECSHVLAWMDERDA